MSQETEEKKEEGEEGKAAEEGGETGASLPTGVLGSGKNMGMS